MTHCNSDLLSIFFYPTCHRWKRAIVNKRNCIFVSWNVFFLIHPQLKCDLDLNRTDAPANQVHEENYLANFNRFYQTVWLKQFTSKSNSLWNTIYTNTNIGFIEHDAYTIFYWILWILNLINFSFLFITELYLIMNH